MKTIYFAASQTDGYVTVNFFETEELRDLDYEMDEGYQATDSQGSFQCEDYEGTLRTLDDIIESVDIECTDTIDRFLDSVNEILGKSGLVYCSKKLLAAVRELYN